MFVNPSSAFVGWPSVVASSSGSAKNALYARLLPSTMNSSASRAGASSRFSSAPVRVFGTRSRVSSDTQAEPRDPPTFRAARRSVTAARRALRAPTRGGAAAARDRRPCGARPGRGRHRRHPGGGGRRLPGRDAEGRDRDGRVRGSRRHRARGAARPVRGARGPMGRLSIRSGRPGRRPGADRHVVPARLRLPVRVGDPRDRRRRERSVAVPAGGRDDPARLPRRPRGDRGVRRDPLAAAGAVAELLRPPRAEPGRVPDRMVRSLGRPGSLHPLRRGTGGAHGGTRAPLPPPAGRSARAVGQHRSCARGDARRRPWHRRRPRAHGSRPPLGERPRLRVDDDRLAIREPVVVPLLAAPRLPSAVPPALPGGAVMPTFSTIAVFLLAAAALAVVPGPAVTYIVTQSIDQGRRAGLVSALGVATGGLVHVAAATVGLSALIASSAEAFTVVKLVGGAYLIGVGIRRILTRDPDDADGRRAERAPLSQVYRQGVIVNILNPKTALFFLAFLPQFVDPDRGAVWPQVAFLGTLFVLVAVLSDMTYALVSDAIAGRIRRTGTGAMLRRWFAGGVFIALGIRSAAARRTT